MTKFIQVFDCIQWKEIVYVSERMMPHIIEHRRMVPHIIEHWVKYYSVCSKL